MEITSEGFIKIVFNNIMLERASEKARDLGVLNNSIRQGQGNIVGFLGEELVAAAFPDAESHNTFQHDISMPSGIPGQRLTFEVKSKDRTVDPQLHYEASVANYNTSQRADYYVFTSIFRDKRTNSYLHGHVIGLIKKTDYKGLATFLRVGDIDPSNGWVVKAACYNVPYEKLVRFS